jgi:hypothetical protein
MLRELGRRGHRPAPYGLPGRMHVSGHCRCRGRMPRFGPHGPSLFGLDRGPPLVRTMPSRRASGRASDVHAAARPHSKDARRTDSEPGGMRCSRPRSSGVCASRVADGCLRDRQLHDVRRRLHARNVQGPSGRHRVSISDRGRMHRGHSHRFRSMGPHLPRRQRGRHLYQSGYLHLRPSAGRVGRRRGLA